MPSLQTETFLQASAIVRSDRVVALFDQAQFLVRQINYAVGQNSCVPTATVESCSCHMLHAKTQGRSVRVLMWGSKRRADQHLKSSTRGPD